jgi:hypothetical protein
MKTLCLDCRLRFGNLIDVTRVIRHARRIL